MHARTLLAFAATTIITLTGCTKDNKDDGGGSGGGSSSGGSQVGQLSGNCTVNRIYNGESCPAAIGPVVFLLGVDAKGNAQYSCTGTFITQNKVLTASHCDPRSAGPGLSLIAVTNPSLSGPGAVGVRVTKFTKHPLANPNAFVASYDVAVATLADSVNAATLPLLTSERTKVGQDASLYGFGLEANQKPSVLNGKSAIAPLAADVTVADVTRTEVTFGSTKQGACPGDSGGPAVRRSENGDIGIIGVTSGGLTEECKPATLSHADFEEIARGRISQADIDAIEEQYPNGIPQDIYINTQDDVVVNFILEQAPDAEVR
jgi:hypothetical protein